MIRIIVLSGLVLLPVFSNCMNKYSEEPIILGTAIVDEKKIEIIEGVNYGFHCLKCDLINLRVGMYSLNAANIYYKKHKKNCSGNGLAEFVFCYPKNKKRFESYCPNYNCTKKAFFSNLSLFNLKRDIKKHRVRMHDISKLDDIKVKEKIIINLKLIKLGLITSDGHFTDKVTINNNTISKSGKSLISLSMEPESLLSKSGIKRRRSKRLEQRGNNIEEGPQRKKVKLTDTNEIRIKFAVGQGTLDHHGYFIIRPSLHSNLWKAFCPYNCCISFGYPSYEEVREAYLKHKRKYHSPNVKKTYVKVHSNVVQSKQQAVKVSNYKSLGSAIVYNGAVSKVKCTTRAKKIK